MIYILYGFPCEMDFSHHESLNPARVACDEGTLIMLNALRKVEDRENHVRWIYLFSTWGKVGNMRDYLLTFFHQNM